MHVLVYLTIHLWVDIFITDIFSFNTENTEVSVRTHVQDAKKWTFWVKMNIHLKC